MYNLILPPSTNWFQPNAISLRYEDRIIAVGSFKFVVVYKIPEERGQLKSWQVISHSSVRVAGVSIYPKSDDIQYGSTLATMGASGELSLYNIPSRSLISKQNLSKTVKEVGVLNSLCWATVKGEDTVVLVGDKGIIFLWQPKYYAVRALAISGRKNLTVVEVLPQSKDEVLVASSNTVLHVSLQSGNVLNQFKGHDNTIYCLKICPASLVPQEFYRRDTETDWRKLDEHNGDSETPLVFATSDYSRNILVWDLSMKRYVRHASAPVSISNGKKGQKERNHSKNQHISLCWSLGGLYSSTIHGEIVKWSTENTSTASDSMKSKLVTHCHSGVIYNLHSFDNTLISFSNDRVVHGYDLGANCSAFKMNTIGFCPSSMAFSPHDAYRLALGMQSGGIKLLTFDGEDCMKVQHLFQGSKDKIMSVAWHPTEESKILFSTSEGQVGILNVFSNSVSRFAFHHQKASYKVEWGLPILPQKLGLEETWLAYSMGDREILAYNLADMVKDPIKVKDYLFDGGSSMSTSLSEFSFSPDQKVLAIGDLNGGIKIFDRLTLNCLYIISRVRKVIQHLLWKPPTLSPDSPFYTLAVASGESSVFVFEIDAVCEEALDSENKKFEPVSIHQPKCELRAHSNRAVWLSWSPHDDNLLASASYDNTAQVWNYNSGEPIGNYSGHHHRVFRVEFSPSNPDSLLSFAEENCLHQWTISSLGVRTPKESAAFLKETRKKFLVPEEEKREASPSNLTSKNDHVEDTSTKLPSIVDASSKGPGRDAHSSRNAQRKSSFPLFHNVSSRKKSFHHMCLLSLAEAKVSEINSKNQRVIDDEDLEELSEELDESSHKTATSTTAVESANIMTHVSCALEKYRCYIPEDHPTPEAEDICFYLNFFGSLPQVDDVINKEIQNHDASASFSRANLMHCWRGSIESRIRWAASQKCLDPFLVSAAPQVSFSLWQFACDAYADQLIEENDIITAASYLVCIHKDEAAVDLLIKHKFLKEALVIAKHKLGFNRDVIEKVLRSWSCYCIYEGNFELASLLNLHLGDIEEAARVLSRRSDPRSLIIAAHLYICGQRLDMAEMTAILSFQEASSRNEFYKFEPILRHLPGLNWCRSVHLCQQVVLEHLDCFKRKLGIEPLSSISDLKCLDIPLFDAVKNKWTENDIQVENYPEYYRNLKEKLSVQRLPSSTKHLWYMLSLCVTEIIFCSFCDANDELMRPNWESALKNALNSLNLWGKVDQTFYFTHLLLPKGISSSNDLGILLTSGSKDVLDLMYSNYASSEVETILQFLKDDSPTWVPWLTSEEDLNEPLESFYKNHVTNGSLVSNGQHHCEPCEPELNNKTSSFNLSENGKEITLNGDKMEKVRRVAFYQTSEEFYAALQSYLNLKFHNKKFKEDLTEMMRYLSQHKQIATDRIEFLCDKINSIEFDI